MVVDLQKANFWKRVAAWLFDGILLCVLAVGCGTLLAEVLHYDTHAENLQAAYDKYETQYGVVFEMTAEEYAAMSEEAQKNYDAAYGALLTDQMAVTAYNKVMNQSLLIITFSILAAILVLEFAVPLWIGNGQTLGKKIFALGLIRTDSVRVNSMQLFARAVLGKFTLETMIPVYILLMIFFGNIGLVGTAVLLALGVVQLVLLVATRNSSQIHDLIAGTVVVDISSQTIFRDTEELIAYTKRIHAERAARQQY
jgi:uncharacterized RDD family membrane protein YckC